MRRQPRGGAPRQGRQAVQEEEARPGEGSSPAEVRAEAAPPGDAKVRKKVIGHLRRLHPMD